MRTEQRSSEMLSIPLHYRQRLRMTPSSRPPLTGSNLLRDPTLIEGMRSRPQNAATWASRGCCRRSPSTLAIQVARIHMQLSLLDSDLQKYLFLSDLQSRNETLYYAVLMSDPATFMPLVYTPTVGEACQKFDHFLRAARGMYLPISAKGRVKELLAQLAGEGCALHRRDRWRAHSWAWAISASAGWVFRSASCRSTPPAPACRRSSRCRSRSTSAPTTKRCSKIRSISGCASSACAAPNTTPSSTSSSQAVQKLYPKCCLQWEDFANFNAVPILARYRDKICTYNDDIQGTAAVALAGIFGALRISKQKLADQRFLFLGGGSAATGIAELISEAMAPGGPLGRAEARTATGCSTSTGLMVDFAHRPGRFPEAFRPRASAGEHVSSRRSKPSSRPASSASAPCRSCSISRSSRRWRGSTSGRSSSPIRTRPRAPNARPKKPTDGRTAGRSLPAAAHFRRSSSAAGNSFPVRATTSISSPRWAWPCLPPRRSG